MKLARALAACLALGFMVLIVLGARHYSTLLERIASDPLVSAWTGPADLKVGASGTYAPANLPRESLAERFKALPDGGGEVTYRFAVKIPKALQDSGEEASFSPNWVVHRTWQVFVDGVWTQSGHGASASGDILYQKVVIALPRQAVRNGQATVEIVAQAKRSDIGIQHLGKILVGPTAVLQKIHVEAEFAMGSYYLLFLAAEGAIFVFFAMFWLLAETRRGFGVFVAYAFLCAAIHLSIGNFLEALLPFSIRVWAYFLAKGGSAAALGLFLGHLVKGPWGSWLRRAAAIPAVVMVGLLATNAGIPAMHNASAYSLIAVVLAFVAAPRTPLGSRMAGGAYLLFLLWAQFLYAVKDFDYRPLADLGFFFVVAWTTIAAFGLAQQRASGLDRLLKRLVGKKLARFLATGDAGGRATREVTIALLDARHVNRLLPRLGVEKTLEALDRWIELVTATVEQHGGEVHKIMGDKILVVWGLTAAEPESAKRATQCAIALREAGLQWNRARLARGETSLVWTGAYVTGPAVIGRIGSGSRTDYSVFGPTVGRAFTMLGLAKDRAVDAVLDAETEARVAAFAIVEPLDGEDAGSVLIGHTFDQGAARIAHDQWVAAYGGLKQGARVYDAGANQSVFVPAARPLGGREAA